MPSEATLTKTQFVLPKTFAGGASTNHPYVVFEAEATENEVGYPAVEIEVQRWADMGSPETITVTLEPGDTLNG